MQRMYKLTPSEKEKFIRSNINLHIDGDILYCPCKEKIEDIIKEFGRTAWEDTKKEIQTFYDKYGHLPTYIENRHLYDIIRKYKTHAYRVKYPDRVKFLQSLGFDTHRDKDKDNFEEVIAFVGQMHAVPEGKLFNWICRQIDEDGTYVDDLLYFFNRSNMYFYMTLPWFKKYKKFKDYKEYYGTVPDTTSFFNWYKKRTKSKYKEELKKDLL